MWTRLLDRMARRLIRRGRLTLTYPDGTVRVYGPGGGACAAMEIRTARALRALCIDPELALGEGYMNETIVIGGAQPLEDLLRLLLRNRRPDAFPRSVRALDRVRYHARAVIQRNSALTARANVAHHYDLSDDLYRLMLDGDMQYSCAYFARPGMTLDEAQLAKKRLIARKLLIEKDMHVLDIGCGWGGLAMTLAGEFGARVTGVTLSDNQLATAQARIREAGLEDRITLRLLDYRALNDRFDRIVSVGMLEHVGLPQYETYFQKLGDLLDADGVALIHTIGRSAPPMPHSAWINRYIFPGGYVPSLSELLPALERSGLWQSDIEVWRLHYAYTLRAWRDRFEANVDTVLDWYDARFVRMWRYYLTACILSFEEMAQCVYQLQLAHKRDAVPLTRDYLYDPGTTARRHAAE